MKQAEFEEKERLFRAYLFLRRGIGILGIFFPFILLLGHILAEKKFEILPSISHYYYGDTTVIFTGILFAIGVFLFSYPGYDRFDNILGCLAGFCAILVVLFPTVPPGSDEATWISTVHLISAAILFLIFAAFSLCRFTKTHPDPAVKKQGFAKYCGFFDRIKKEDKPKMKRNTIYKYCGTIILFCIILIALYKCIFNDSSVLGKFKPVFILETIALIAFGLSWLVKGETFLKDD